MYHHACHHAHQFFGATPGFGTTPGFHSDPTSLLNSLGPLGMLGLLFAGVLAILFFFLWTTHNEQTAHADIGMLADGERQWSEAARHEAGPYISFASYDQAPKLYQASDEQPQAQYPEMPLDEPPGKYD